MSALIVHHLEQSRSQRVLWLLEELGVDYELKLYSRSRAGRAPRELYEVHPLGRSPVITHDGRTLAESGAIVEYLLDTFGQGRMRPQPETEDLDRYRFFMHFAEGSMTAPLLVKLITSRLSQAVPLLGKGIARRIDQSYTDPQLALHLKYVESALEGRQWLAGELSGADVMMCYPLEASITRSGIAGDFPNIRAYLARIGQRSAWQRAIERGGAMLLGG